MAFRSHNTPPPLELTQGERSQGCTGAGTSGPAPAVNPEPALNLVHHSTGSANNGLETTQDAKNVAADTHGHS